MLGSEGWWMAIPRELSAARAREGSDPKGGAAGSAARRNDMNGPDYNPYAAPTETPAYDFREAGRSR